MTAKVVENIKAQMALSSYGFAAIIDGILNPATFRTSKNQCAAIAIGLKSGAVVIPSCLDAECDCVVKAMAEIYPDIAIVPVTLTAVDRQKKD